MPSPSWLTVPSTATSRAASSGRPAAKTPNGAARIASPSLQACRCWAVIGAVRPRRRFSSVPRSLNPAPRNGPSSRSAIHRCQAASTRAVVSPEPYRASSSPEKIAYSVSSVPAGCSATYPVMRPQRRRISEGLRFSAGAPSASPTASPSRAPRPRARRAAGSGRVGRVGAIAGLSRTGRADSGSGRAERGLRGLRAMSATRAVRLPRRRPFCHSFDTLPGVRTAGHRLLAERAKAQVSTAFLAGSGRFGGVLSHP